jgi:hypothetical protein
MQNFVIYGTDSQTVLGLDEAVILVLPDGIETGDDDFEDWLEENFYSVDQRSVAPLEDVMDSFVLALRAEGVADDLIGRVLLTVGDAVSNNVYN